VSVVGGWELGFGGGGMTLAGRRQSEGDKKKTGSVIEAVSGLRFSLAASLSLSRPTLLPGNRD